jgi:vancomycin resistance protein YoaR
MRLFLTILILALASSISVSRASAHDLQQARVAPTDSFPVEIGSFTTTLIGSTPARTANVRLAADALDGLVLAPGEELSFNAAVGNRTPDRGYQDAPVILREVRQIQCGGGVCQVASTLFAAGLLSGMTAVERHRHSSPVDYIALGEDATIAWGAKDLRLRNDSERLLRVRAEVVGRSLSVRIESSEPLEDRYELETRENDLPITSSDGAGLPGREIELFRVRHAADGGVERELILRDVYPSSRPAGERRPQ